MKVVGVIPARYASTRFPGKPLAPIMNKPMIQWVYEGAQGSRLLSELYVATDDERIQKAVLGFGGKVKMTSPEAPSGSDRIAEAIKGDDFEIVVNIQGDEPLISGEIIDTAIKALTENNAAVVGTLCKEIKEESELNNPNVVKVVRDQNNYALYFSRSRIPSTGRTFKHIGIYVYKFKFLMEFLKLERTPLEKTERLEQLRILENGFKIGVGEITQNLISVDTPEDLNRVEKFLQGKQRWKK